MLPLGRLAAQSHHADVVDLAVVEGALRRRDGIVTSDARELGAILATIGERVPLASI